MPKKSALTDYSYRTSHENQRAFLAGLDVQMIYGGLATGSEAIFDLDFHAVMHWVDLRSARATVPLWGEPAIP